MKKTRNKLTSRQHEATTSANLTLHSYYKRASSEKSSAINKRYLDDVREEFKQVKETLLDERLMELEREKREPQLTEEIEEDQDYTEDVSEYEEEEDLALNILTDALSEDTRDQLLQEAAFTTSIY